MNEEELIPPPPLPGGYTWVTFRGGSLEGEVRIAKLPLEVGATYERMSTGERWVYRAGCFQFVPEA